MVLKSRILNGDRSAQSERGNSSDRTPGEESISPLRQQIVCIVATLAAGVIFTLTEHDDHQHTWWCAFEILMQTVLVIVGTFYFRTRVKLFPDSSLLLPPLLMVAAFSLICEPIQRLIFNHGHSFEVLVMHSQCNLMLALAVCGFRLNFQRLAMLIAVFLTIFSCSISNARGLVPLTILFAIAAISWLVVSWWETVDRRLVRTTKQPRSRLWLMTAVVIPVVLLPMWGFGANSATSALRGFMPGSGGSGGSDPYSRGGVNDGDALVAGNENIKSFAPLEDAPFLESKKPSLYDVINDQFDSPVKKNIAQQQRAIALPAEMMKHIHQKMAEAKQAGREFSLIRDNRNPNNKRIRDLDSPAAFYVAGQVPARFRMEVYEHFDGEVWYPLGDPPATEAKQKRLPEMKKVDDRHWLSIPGGSRAMDIYQGSMTHSLKVANLDGNVIPSPPNLIGVNIRHVDLLSMFSVSDSGIASLQRKSLPTMTSVNVLSEYENRSGLEGDYKFSLTSRKNVHVSGVLPKSPAMDTVRQLAAEWTEGIPRGWKQIRAIERKLRENYVLDRSFRVDPDCEDAVLEFLTKTRRGPEYLFASSSACLLRALGYRTRLVSGFYASLENYDSRKQHTAVFAENAHFWCEVNICYRTWVTVEPSPGYELTQPPPGILGQAWLAIVQLCKFLFRHIVVVLLVGGLLGLLFSQRRFLFDLGLSLQWKLSKNTSAEVRARRLGILVDKRLKLARLSRNNGTTLRRWARNSVLAPVRNELIRVADIADAAMFGHGTEFTTENGELNELAAQLTYRRLRQLERHV